MDATRELALTEPSGYGEKIRQYRLAEGLSVARLAARAGLHPNALRKIEDGRTSVPHATTRTQLAHALGLSDQQREHLERRLHGPVPSELSPRVPFIGRWEELQIVRNHLQGAGAPLLLFHGEPGIGKSALLVQAAALGIERGMRVLQGGCSRWSVQQSPYSPLAEAFEAGLQRPYTQLRRDLVGCEWLSQLLPQLVDAPFHLPRCHASGVHERRLIFLAALRFLLQSAGRRGALLVLDDLHWAGADALALLVYLVRNAPNSRLRFIAAYRDTEVHGGGALLNVLADLAHGELVVEHSVGPFDDAEAEQLLDALVSDMEHIDPPVRRRVLQRGDGVPFFLVSCGLSLREDTQKGRTSEQLPWSITESVRQRAASLSTPARDILAAVALTGNMHRSLLSALSRVPISELVAPLEEAQRARLIKEAGPCAYSTEHDAIREAIEADLSAARRAALHLQIAEALEHGRSQGVPARPAEIAWHYMQADAPAQALPHLLRAGDEAEAVFAHHDAEQHYAQALSLAERLGSPRLEAEAWEKLGAIYSATARYNQALHALERTIQVHREHDNLDAEAAATARLARVHVLAGAPGEGRRRAEQMIARLAEGTSLRSLAHLQAAITQCLQREGEHALELKAAEAATAYATQIDDEGLSAEMLARQGIALEMLHRLPEAWRVLSAAIPRLERLGNLDILSVALRELGWICLSMADYEQGRQCRQQAVQVAENMQDPARIAVELANLAMAEVVGGFWSEAESHVKRAIALARSVGTPPSTIYSLFVKGVLELLRGVDWAQAEDYLDECGAIALKAGDIAMIWQVQWALAERDLFVGDAERALARFAQFGGIKRYREMNASDAPYLLRIFAALNAAVGRLEDAEGLIRPAIRGSEEEQDRLHLVEAFRVYAQINAAMGRLDEAAAMLVRSRDLAGQTRYRFGEGRAVQGLGLVCAAQGKVSEARGHLTEACAIFAQLGATKNWQRADEALGELRRDVCIEDNLLAARLQRV